MYLTYTGSRDHETGTGAIPLPEGWPAEDGDEPNEELASLKLASGLYARRGPKADWKATGLADATITDAAGQVATVTDKPKKVASDAPKTTEEIV